MSVRVRFAPSPTGSLHVGNARTALFNWLFARRHGGRFVLRSEDTDPERSRREFETAIVEDLRWLGLDWDEGPDVGGSGAPYRQSEAVELHRAAAGTLLSSGQAYRCFCSTSELEEERRRQEAAGQPPRYSGRCRDFDALAADRRHRAGDPWAIRFRMPAEEIAVSDLVKGEVRFHGRDLDDFILLRRDCSASYHLAVVVDDHRMGITHVIRGEDHLSNTPRQIALARALGYDSPCFAHLPLIVGWDGAPLSKRHGDDSVRALRDMGLFPEAVVNYLGLLGWSPPEGVPELMTPGQMIEHFTFERVSRSPARFDQERLLWVNHQYFRRMPVERLLAAVGPMADDDGLTRRAVEALREDAHSVASLESAIASVRQDPEPWTLHLTEADRRALDAVRGALVSAPVNSAREAQMLLDHVVRDLPIKKRDLMHAVRLALIGQPQGPPVATLLWVLGRERASRRLAQALTASVGS